MATSFHRAQSYSRCTRGAVSARARETTYLAVLQMRTRLLHVQYLASGTRDASTNQRSPLFRVKYHNLTMLYSTSRIAPSRDIRRDAEVNTRKPQIWQALP